MVLRVRRYFDVRFGEGRRVLFSFLYVAVVAASFLLAKPIRNGLFVKQYGPYALVYVYAAVPLVLSLFIPVYVRVAARFGSRTMAVATLIFFSSNVVLFWYAFRFHADAIAVRGSLAWYLPGAFYVWVNCFGVIASVQAWSFANLLFDTRQARRLFGLIAVGASLGSIGAGLLARVLVRPIGGAVNMLLVLAGLILSAAAIVAVAHMQLQVGGPARRTRAPRNPLADSLRRIAGSSYLRLMAAMVFVAAVTTQWITFQLQLVASQRLAEDADALVSFFGTFNFALGAVSFVLQLALVGPALRRLGLGVTILVLPVALATGSLTMILLPGLLTVLLTSSLDQGLRFSIDKASYELLYLPLAPAQRTQIKAAIDIVVSRVADAVAAVLLGVATEGFLFFHGLRFGVRGTAALNLGFLGAWILIAGRLRAEYVRTIQSSIHRHRIASEHAPDVPLDRNAASMLAEKLVSEDPADVRYALDWLDAQGLLGLDRQVRQLLSHREADIRRRALAMLSAARDTSVSARVMEMLRDSDLGVRTEALLYVTREMRVDPIRQLEELGDVEDFSIRAGMAAFLASPGPSQNLDAARLLLEAMARSEDEDGVRDRLQAARVLSLVPGLFIDLLVQLIGDPDESVARQAIHATSVVMRDEVVTALLTALGRPELTADAAERLARYGNAFVPRLAQSLHDEHTAVAIRREVPQVLVRIGTPIALEVLIDGLLQSDVMLRQRVIASLNKLHDAHPEVTIDGHLVELVLAAEIAGHYRSYQVLAPLREQLKDDDPGLEGFRRSMDQELERIFRLIALLVPGPGLHDAYVGVRSGNPTVRENALEYLDNVLKPDLRRLLLPLIDSHVTIEERIAIANQLVGAPLETAEQAATTLLASEDSWLRSCGAYAVGALRLHSLEPDLLKLADAPDEVIRESAQVALHRLSGEPDTTHAPAVVGMEAGIG
ncbi:MAG: Npt1/Npt2 family nucleotide transporter [Vicinamibacterales bacterium]